MKKLLFNLLGEEKYLKFISKGFISMYKKGMKKDKYPQHYFINTLIKKGDYVIDLGANLGYYTIPFSNAVGENGKVFSVEPVPLFKKILRANTTMANNPKNIQIFNYALGKEEGEIEMGLFVENGVFRHGLTKVLSKEDSPSKVVKVKMTHPESLFNDLKQLDYIKCDIEGFEIEVLPLFINIIKKFTPTLQVEFGSSESRDTIYAMLKAIDYKMYKLESGKLTTVTQGEIVSDDVYFVPNSRNI